MQLQEDKNQGHSEPTLLTVSTLARRLGCSESKLRNMIREGTIPFLLLGRSYRFEWDTVYAHMQHAAQQQASAN